MNATSPFVFCVHDIHYSTIRNCHKISSVSIAMQSHRVVQCGSFDSPIHFARKPFAVVYQCLRSRNNLCIMFFFFQLLTFCCANDFFLSYCFGKKKNKKKRRKKKMKRTTTKKKKRKLLFAFRLCRPMMMMMMMTFIHRIRTEMFAVHLFECWKCRLNYKSTSTIK